MLLALAACSAAPKTVATPRQPLSVQATGDELWSATLATLAEQSIPIKTSDRSSGLITTEEVIVPVSEGRKVADCGPIVGAGRVQYSILIAASTLRITPRFTYANIYGQTQGECVTRGIVESKLEAAIKQRAERH